MTDRITESQFRIERLEGKDEERFWYTSKSKAMETVQNTLNVLRSTSLKGEKEPTVLILGPLGSGREGIARTIARTSRGGRQAWLSINCASFGEEALEAELFGYEKGAFPEAQVSKPGLVEAGSGGTLFLDEITFLSPVVQSKILRFLQNGTFRRLGGDQDLSADVRILAGASYELEVKTHQGRFKDELFNRLKQVQIDLPSLKERHEDIVLLATQFAQQAFQNRGKKFEGFSEAAKNSLLSYSWPGNLHELYSVMDRVALTWQENGAVSDKGLFLSERLEVKSSLRLLEGENLLEDQNLNYTALKKKWCDSFEKEYLIFALTKHSGNVSVAAREAKLDRSNFLRLLRRHGIKAQTYRKQGQPYYDEEDQIKVA